MTAPTQVNPSWPALKRGYALWIIVAGVVSMAIAGVVMWLLGADAKSIVVGSIAMGLGVVLSTGPAVVGVKQEYFGMAVLAGSMARMLVCLGIVVVAAITLELPRRPIGLGVGLGLMTSLIAEVMLALLVLSRAERKTEQVTA